jgi:thiol-disulfide isomerase/thioredoxin
MKIFYKITLFTLIVLSFAMPSLATTSEVDTEVMNVAFNNDGTDVKLADFKDKVVILEFWAPWCKYCQRQMPAVSMLAEKYKDESNLKILPVSIDYRGVDAVKNYFKTKGIENLGIYTDEKNKLAKAFNARSIPRFYMFSKTGELLQYFGGVEELDQKLLEKTLKE